jgi:uncharacterized membrane protein
MREWLALATNVAVDAIDWLALVLIVVGAVEAFFRGLRTMLSSPDGHHERDTWLGLGRWLVAGLTFQLAADVLETAITTSWDEVARLAAIAAIAPSSITFSSVTWARSGFGKDWRQARATEAEPFGEIGWTAYRGSAFRTGRPALTLVKTQP